MKITYETQRLSLRFFMLMLVLFALQVAYGLLLSVQQVDPSLLAGTLNFNVARASHLTLGILWIVCGFIGGTLFVAPLLSRREVAYPALVKLLFIALIAIAIWNVATQALAMRGIAGWWKGQPWLVNGLEFLEGGRVFSISLLLGFGMLSVVVLRTFPPIKKWNGNPPIYNRAQK